VSHCQFIAHSAIQAKEQQATDLLIEGMMAIAGPYHRHLRDERLRMAQHELHYGHAAMEGLGDMAGIKPIPAAGAVYQRATHCAFSTHASRVADGTFVSDHGDSRRATITKNDQQGNNRRGRKVNVAGDLAQIVENKAPWQFD
jgi:hypothetical protein